MTTRNFYLFLDLETTGLSPSVDRIVEVGWLLTDNDLNPLTPVTSHVIESDARTIGLITSSPIVEGMHSSTGLLAELIDPKNDSRWPLAAADAELADTLERLLRVYSTVFAIVPEEQRPKLQFVLAGKNVHFDHEFIKNWMPMTAKLLSYRHLDESTVSFMYDYADLTINTSVELADKSLVALPHRAAYDAAQSFTRVSITFNAVRDVLKGQPIDVLSTVQGGKVIPVQFDLNEELKGLTDNA